MLLNIFLAWMPIALCSSRVKSTEKYTPETRGYILGDTLRAHALRELQGTLETLMKSGQTDEAHPEVVQRIQSTLSELREDKIVTNLVWIVWTVAGVVPVLAFGCYRFRKAA